MKIDDSNEQENDNKKERAESLLSRTEIHT
jgi:hypothetical protein